ncbi:MAG: hypothetical protein MRY59_12170 [Aquisalinus sp.]|nr:hypothetical protein [Aquisalinus sp.]
MPRQSISLTKPNDDWLNQMVAREEYSNKTEAVNDLIRQARREQAEVEAIRLRLIKAEQSGVVDASASEILQQIKADLRLNSDL